MDVKNIKQFGPNRLTSDQTKKMIYYDADLDKFVFVSPPTRSDMILQYDTTSGKYEWQSVSYIYVNTDNPDITVTEPTNGATTNTMLRMISPIVCVDTSLNEQSANAVSTIFTTIGTVSILNSVGSSAFGGLLFPMSQALNSRMDYTISAADSDLSLIYIYNVTDTELKESSPMNTINVKGSLYVSQQYINLQCIKMRCEVSSLVFQNAAAHINLKTIELGAYSSAVEYELIPYSPDVLLDLELLPSLEGFIMYARTTGVVTETVLQQLSSSMPTHSGGQIIDYNYGITGLIKFTRCDEITAQSEAYANELINKGYVVILTLNTY